MAALEQPLVVFERADQNGFGFRSANQHSVESIERSADRSVVRTSGANATVFHVTDSDEPEKTETLVNKLMESRTSGKSVWFVVNENPAPQFNERSAFSGVLQPQILDVLESSSADETCDISIPLAFEFDEEQSRAIDVRYAKQLFRELREQSTDPASGDLTGIPFLYVENGCTQRCHAMARFLLEKGVFPLKIFVRGQLKLRTPNHPNCEVDWDFHTAPAVRTNRGLYIIDPSVNENAVPIHKWYEKFSGSPSRKIYAVSHQIYTITPSGCRIDSDPNYQTTYRGLSYYRNALRLQTEEYGFPPCKNF